LHPRFYGFFRFPKNLISSKLFLVAMTLELHAPSGHGQTQI